LLLMSCFLGGKRRRSQYNVAALSKKDTNATWRQIRRCLTLARMRGATGNHDRFQSSNNRRREMGFVARGVHSPYSSTSGGSFRRKKGAVAVVFFLFGSFSFFTIACGNVGKSRGSNRRVGLRIHSPTTRWLNGDIRTRPMLETQRMLRCCPSRTRL